jgi:hypothetical protein
MDERYKEQQKRRLQDQGNQPNQTGRPGAAAPALTPEQRAEVLGSLPAEARTQIENLPERAQGRILARLAQLPAAERPAAIEEFRKRMQEGGRGNRGGQPKPPADAPKSK